MNRQATPELLRRHARPWRIAFILYAIATTVASHWPDFQLAAEVPASDKSLHFLAFGGLTWMLWRTRWLRARRTVTIIALAWAALDEITQGLPVLNRHVSLDDLIASELGVIVASVWLWALRPLGGELNRVRLSRHQFVFDEQFRPPSAWIILGAAFLACALPPLLAWPVLSPMGTARLILIAIVVWALSSLALMRSMQVQLAAAVAEERPCFSCGRCARDVSFDASGYAACPHCGGSIRNGQWEEPSPPANSTMLGLMIRPLIVVTILGLALLAPVLISAALISLSSQNGFLPIFVDLLTGLSDPLIDIVDLAAGLLLMAVATSVYRVDLARWYDRSVRCRRCRHDIRATPTVHGIGRCGECGTPFLRGTGEEPEPGTDPEPETETETETEPAIE